MNENSITIKKIKASNDKIGEELGFIRDDLASLIKIFKVKRINIQIT